MPACVKNDCSGAEASIRIPGYKNLDEILIYDVRSANVWWKADDKQAERQFMLEWTGRTREWREDNWESPDLMICAGHFTESQIKDGRRIPGELPHNHPIPVGHDLSKPLPDFRKSRTEEVIAARRAEAEEAAESRRQKAQAAVAARAEREEELRMAAVAQEMDDKLDAEANWVLAEILRLGPDAIKRILIEKSLLENKLAAETAEKDRAHTLGREQAHQIRYLSRKVRNVKAAARNLAACDKELRQRIKALQKKYKKGKLDLAGLEKALLAEQKKGARLLEYDYIMANPAWAQALTGFTRPQLTRLVGDLEEDDYLERILGPVKTSAGATMSRSHLPAKDILMIFFARLRLNLSLDVVAKMAGISTVTSSLYFHGAGGAVFEFFINKKFKDYPQSQETIWKNVIPTDLTAIVGMYRVSMDGTHIRTRMPYNAGENKQQFCAYKHCHTDLFQILIGADGTTQGVSLASPGSDSDINMILNSSLQSVRGSSARYQDDPQDHRGAQRRGCCAWGQGLREPRGEHGQEGGQAPCPPGRARKGHCRERHPVHPRRGQQGQGDRQAEDRRRAAQRSHQGLQVHHQPLGAHGRAGDHGLHHRLLQQLPLASRAEDRRQRQRGDDGARGRR